MSTFKQKKALNVQLAAAQKKHGAKSQAANRIQYKINQLNQTQRKDSKGRSLGTAVRTSNGSVVKSGTGGTVRTKPTVLSQSQKALAAKKATKKATVKKVTKLPLKHQPQYGAVTTTAKTTTKKTAVNPKTPVKGSTRKARMEHGVRTPIPFGKAFAAARAKGEKVFTWKGKKFTTKRADGKTLTTKPYEKTVKKTTKPYEKVIVSVKKNTSNPYRNVLEEEREKQIAAIRARKLADRNATKNKKKPPVSNSIKKLEDRKAADKKALADKKAASKKALADRKAADRKAADKKAADKRAADTIKAADKKAAAKKAAALKDAENVVQQLANENITTPSFQQLATWTTTKLGAWLKAGKQRVKDAKTNK
tara:strand:- start:178 stop:1275 length:1098 start_codon:yes stop_codon:yes gene_type:complete